MPVDTPEALKEADPPQAVMDGEPLGVLVTDAHERCAVAACESLALAGYRVGTASSERLAPAHWSRFSDARLHVPDPRTASRRFAQEVATIAEEGGFATVIPGNDASVIAISSNRELFADTVRLGLPVKETVDACVNKANLLEKAVEAGFSAPETLVCTTQDEVRAAAEELGYPVVLKPRRTVFSHDGGTRQRQSFMAWDWESLVHRLPEFGFPCLLQRREQGPLISIGGVAADGGLLAIAPSRYIRTWKPDAGSVSFSRTIAAPLHLVASVERLVGSMGWSGIFELELIETSASALSAIDFNPRSYGSMALAVDTGASLPAVWCDWLLKGKATARATARPGVFYRWGDADIRHVARFLREKRLAAGISVLRPRRHTVHPYFRGTDPRPAMARFAQMLWNSWLRRRGRDPANVWQ